jgi:hypothetical protein
MPDVRQQVIDMLKTPRLSSMATITLDGKPWTRYIMIQSDGDFNIRSAGGPDSFAVRAPRAQEAFARSNASA